MDENDPTIHVNNRGNGNVSPGGQATSEYLDDALPRIETIAKFRASYIPSSIGTVDVLGYWEAGLGGARYRRVASEPSHAGKAQSKDGAWWEIADETLYLRQFGCRGNYDAVSRKGANDTYRIDAALAAAAFLDRDIKMGRGLFYYYGELPYPSNLTLIGKRRNTSQFYVDIGAKQAGSRIEATNVRISDVGTVVYNRVALGADDGEYGSGVTLSRYYTDGEPFDTRKVVLERVGYYKAPGSPASPAHGLNGVGRFAELSANDVEVIGFAGAVIHFHWGANAVAVETPVTASYHPNKISVRNVAATDCGRLFVISSGYDVTLEGVRGNSVKRVGDLIPGDEADSYASTGDKGLVGSRIRIRSVTATGLKVDPSACLRVFSIGTSRADKYASIDPQTGQVQMLGLWKILVWKNVVIEDIKLTGADDIQRVIDLTGAVGDITVRNIDATGVGRLGACVRTADCRGQILIDNVQTNAAKPIELTRARGVKYRNMGCAFADRGGLIGDATAIVTSGSEHTKALAEPLTVGATSITLAAGGFGSTGVCYPGDELVIAGRTLIVAGTNRLRSSDTVIPIRPATFAADAGALVYLDLFSDVDVTGTFALYDNGAPMSGVRKINLVGCEFVDIAKQGVSGAARGGMISSRFIRGGQRRLVEPTYPARNIILEAGTENVTVNGCDLGVGAEHFETLLQTSADTGNLRIKDNALGNAAGSHVQIATQNDARLNASQYNEISGNYRKDGGTLSGPSTFYEILSGGVVIYHGTEPPTKGYHKVGSRWVNTAPLAGRSPGGNCTGSGIPGNWTSDPLQ